MSEEKGKGINKSFVNFLKNRVNVAEENIRKVKKQKEDSTPEEEKNIFEDNVVKNENNQNDGSLKDLLSRMNGDVIVIHKEEEKVEEESENESDSESDSDYEQEKFNHFIREKTEYDEFDEAFDEDVNNEELKKTEKKEVKEKTIKPKKEKLEKKEKIVINQIIEKIQDNNDKPHVNKNRKFVEIYVENIPSDKTEADIKKFFSKYNKNMQKIKMLINQETGEFKGKAYIKYGTKEDVKTILENEKTLMMNENLLTIKFIDYNNEITQGNKIINTNSNPKSYKSEKNNKFLSEKNDRLDKRNQYEEKNDRFDKKNQYEKKPFKEDYRNNQSHTAFIRNLSLKTDETVLKRLIKQAGDIGHVRIIKSNDGKSKGFGYIDFKNETSLSNAIKNFNGITIDGKEISVEKAKSSYNESFQPTERLGKKKRRAIENKTKYNSYNNSY